MEVEGPGKVSQCREKTCRLREAMAWERSHWELGNEAHRGATQGNSFTKHLLGAPATLFTHITSFNPLTFGVRQLLFILL